MPLRLIASLFCPSIAKRLHRRITVAATFAALALGSSANTALAAEPASTRPLRIVVPFTPGTAVDVIGRLVAQHLSTTLGRQVIVDNKPGAAGAIGSRDVAKTTAAQDNILFTVHSTVVANPFLYSSLGYAPNELEPLAMAGVGGYMLVASPTSKFRTVSEFIAAAKAQPDTLKYGSYGLGSGPHLCMEMLRQSTGISAVHVPYKAAPLTDLVAGLIDVSMEPIAPVLPYVDEKRVIAFAYSTSVKPGKARSNIPSVSETVPGFECGNWVGFFASNSASKEFIDKLSIEIQKVLEQPDVKARLPDFAIQPKNMTRTEFANFVKNETSHWGDVIRKAGIKLE